MGEARALGEELPTALERFGGTRPRHPAPILGGNFVLELCERLEPVELDADVRAVRGTPRLALRFLSPFRLERPVELKRRGAGFLDRDCFPAAFFLDRLWRRLYFLTHGGYPDGDERRKHQPDLPADVAVGAERLLWSDLPVRGTREKARPYTLGGVRGSVIFEGLDDDWTAVLAAGSHVHAGTSTAYGFGRYTLGEISFSDAFCRPSRTLLERVRDPATLGRALVHVLASRDDEPPEEAVEAESLVDSLGRELARGTCRPRPLQVSQSSVQNAVPVRRDRVAQRAAVEVLAPAVDTLLEDASFAYRRGFSRQGAERAIERAYADGYRYVLDTDLRAFFDRVDRTVLFARLDALYPGEPLLELLRAWIEAPVLVDGEPVERDRGLPPGSPISPLLAHLVLDVFDEELMDQDLLLARSGDDFVVLTKDPETAGAVKIEDALGTKASRLLRRRRDRR